MKRYDLKPDWRNKIIKTIPSWFGIKSNIMNREPVKVLLGGCEYSLTLLEAMVLRNDLASQINEYQDQIVQNLNQKVNIPQPEVKSNT